MREMTVARHWRAGIEETLARLPTPEGGEQRGSGANSRARDLYCSAANLPVGLPKF